MLVGGFAGKFIAVSFASFQEFQCGLVEMADDPVLLTLTNLCARLEPFEVDIGCIFNLTVKPALIANVEFQGLDLAPENRWHCFAEEEKKGQITQAVMERKMISGITGTGMNTHSSNPG